MVFPGNYLTPFNHSVQNTFILSYFRSVEHVNECVGHIIYKKPSAAYVGSHRIVCQFQVVDKYKEQMKYNWIIKEAYNK